MGKGKEHGPWTGPSKEQTVFLEMYWWCPSGCIINYQGDFITIHIQIYQTPQCGGLYLNIKFQIAAQRSRELILFIFVVWRIHTWELLLTEQCRCKLNMQAPATATKWPVCKPVSDWLGTYLVMSCRCGSVMHCVCHHFIKLPQVLWHHRTDSGSQTTKQTSLGCSTETVGANTNNEMTEFQPSPISKHVFCTACTAIYVNMKWFVKDLQRGVMLSLGDFHQTKEPF